MSVTLGLLHRSLRLPWLLSLHHLGHHCTCNYGAIVGEMPSGSKEVKTTVSSLRIDNIASAGLNISRRTMWEYFIDGQVMHNGKMVEKKSAIVKEGDVIDVDSLLVDQNQNQANSKGGGKEQESSSHDDGRLFKRGRVIVKEIGEQTKRNNRWHVTLLRHRHFDTVRKKQQDH